MLCCVVSEMDQVVAINYEGGKIITHVMSSPHLVAFANCQFVMDAPYAGRVADESVRAQGRSEEQFAGYDKTKKQSQLRDVFSRIHELHFSDTVAPSTSSDITKLAPAATQKLVIQIARGRSGASEYQDIEPILTEVGISLDKVTVKFGYRSTEYIDVKNINEPFVFVNIGMIGILQGDSNVFIGELCNAENTVDILSFDGNSFTVRNTNSHGISGCSREDSKNILNAMTFRKISLYGLADDMPFVTPSAYPRSAFEPLLLGKYT